MIWAPPTSSPRWCCVHDAEPESCEGFGERGSEPLWRFQADPCTQPVRRGPWGLVPHLSLLLSAVTSRPMASLLSVASSSSRCSFLRLALMRWDSSSASSSCLLSCLTLVFPFSACQGEARGSGGSVAGPAGLGGRGAGLPAPCTALPFCARLPPAAGPPSASCPSASPTWRPPVSLCAHSGGGDGSDGEGLPCSQCVNQTSMAHGGHFS